MKTKLVIEIETPDKDKLTIVPEEGTSEKDYTKKELEEFREEYAKDLHTSVTEYIKEYIEEDFEEEFIDDMEELYVDLWDTFKDYGIKVGISKKE